MKMSFDDFKEIVVDKVLEYLPESFKNSEVSLNVITKPNDVKLTGLTIRKADSCAAPTIYLEEFYNQIEAGENISEIMKRIADVRIANEIENVNLDQFLDFDFCKDKILPRLYGVEMNNELLNHRAYTRVGDFVVIYAVELGCTSNGRISLPIDVEILKKWGIEIGELHKTALDNQKRLQIGTFRSMMEVIKSMFHNEGLEDDLFMEMVLPSEEAELYVISNKNNINGASMILDKEFMDGIADVLGDEFIILPSSIHEVLAVPNNKSMEIEYMEEMVYEINRTQVSAEERLSNHVYRYSKKNGLVRAI